MIQFDERVTVGAGHTHTDFTRENKSEYRFSSWDSNTAVYKKKSDESKLVVVFGDEKGLEECIAVLKGNDVELYERLNLGKDSSPGSVAGSFMLIGTAVLLFVVLSLVLAYNAPSLHLLWQVPVVGVLSIVLLIVYLIARDAAVEKYRLLSLAKDIHFRFQSEAKKGHYIRLLKKLTSARDRIRAENAKKLLRYL